MVSRKIEIYSEKPKKKRKQWKNWRLNIYTNTEKKMFLKSCECLTHSTKREHRKASVFFFVGCLCIFRISCCRYRIRTFFRLLRFFFGLEYLFVYLLMFSSQISKCSVGFFFFLSFLLLLPRFFHFAMFVLLAFTITYSCLVFFYSSLSLHIYVCIVNTLVRVSMNLCTET